MGRDGIFRASDREVTQYGRGLLKVGWGYAGVDGNNHHMFIHEASGTLLRLPNSPHGQRWCAKARSQVRRATKESA